MAGKLFLSTDSIEPGLRNEYWRELARPFFDIELGENNRDPHLAGSFSSRFFGALSLGRTTFNAQRYRRDQRLVRRSGLHDFYLVQLRVSGETVGDCDGSAIAIQPGDVTVFDLGRTWSSSASPGVTLSTVVPREPIDKAARGGRLHGAVLKASSPVTQLLADFISGLYQLPASVDGADALAIEEAAVALMASTLGRHAFDEVSDDRVRSHILRRRVLDFIDANLTELDLSPALLTSRFRVSRAHLYRLFAADGGVMSTIRNRRLNAAYRELRRTSGAMRSITEIAHEFGFSSSSHFLGAFRARFGMAPSEARSEASVSMELDGQAPSVQAHFAGVRSMVLSGANA